MKTAPRVMAAATAFAVLAGSLTGCATIVQGTRDDVKVRSVPPGVTVKTGDRQTTTPGELKDLKRNQDHKVTFEKDGLPPRETTLESVPSWWLLGNLLFGGLIGLVVDFATGAAYRLKPANVEMDMSTGVATEFDD